MSDDTEKDSNLVLFRKPQLTDEFGMVTAAGRRISDRLVDRTVERLLAEATGQEVDKPTEVIQFQNERLNDKS